MNCIYCNIKLNGKDYYKNIDHYKCGQCKTYFSYDLSGNPVNITFHTFPPDPMITVHLDSSKIEVLYSFLEDAIYIPICWIFPNNLSEVLGRLKKLMVFS